LKFVDWPLPTLKTAIAISFQLPRNRAKNTLSGVESGRDGKEKLDKMGNIVNLSWLEKLGTRMALLSLAQPPFLLRTRR
jgi:hypothetical protein